MRRALVIACALAVARAALAAPSHEQAILWLEDADGARWGEAVHALLPEPDARLDRSALSSVLGRLDALAAADRERVAQGLRDRIDERRVRDALVRMLDDPDERVRNAAIATLTDDYRIPVDDVQEAARINARLAGRLGPAQLESGHMAPAMIDLYVREHAARLGLAADDVEAFRKQAARQSLPGTRAEPYFSALLPLAEASQWQVRSRAFDLLSVLIDERVHPALLHLAAHPDEYVLEGALETLVARGALEVACDPVLAWALSPNPVRAGSHRYQRLNWAGYTCADRQLPAWVERYRRAGDTEEKQDHQRLIENAPSLLPRQHALLEELAGDPDGFLSGFARQRLEARPASPGPDPRRVLRLAARSAAVALMLAALVLAAATFLWGLRVLQVRRLLRHLGISKTRSLAAGLVSVEGEVQPVEGQLLIHPDTEEACVYYAGAERSDPQHRFWLVDESGRVLVEPRGALLLSEDGVLVPGERVRLVATAGRASRGSDGAASATILRAGGAHTSRFARWGRALLRLVMDRRVTPLLFSDPRRWLLIWDDLHGAPFASPRETALMFASFALAATWMLVFLGAVLTLADDRFAATLWGLIG